MSKIIASAKLSSQNQITLPKEVRKQLNLRQQEVVVFVKENGKIFLVSKIG